MRVLFVLPALALAMAGAAATAAQQSISFVHLVVNAPLFGKKALYEFQLTSHRGDFDSGFVFFDLPNGERYGCGVHAFTSCTYRAAGQILKLEGLINGIRGEYFWNETPQVLRPPDLIIGVAIPPVVLEEYEPRISPPLNVPEPASWAMMLGGFGLAGAAMRYRRPTGRMLT